MILQEAEQEAAAGREGEEQQPGAAHRKPRLPRGCAGWLLAEAFGATDSAKSVTVCFKHKSSLLCGAPGFLRSVTFQDVGVSLPLCSWWASALPVWLLPFFLRP